MDYQANAEKIAANLGIVLSIISSEYGLYFPGDKEERYIFKCRLSRGRKSYTFTFGQSIADGDEEPTMYDVLSCLQKYDVGTYEDFCSEFGYEENSRTAERTYKAVCKEYKAMSRLFTEAELEILSEIQ